MRSAETCPPLAIPLTESPFLEEALASRRPEEQALLRGFADRGYLVVDLGLPDFDDLAASVIAALENRYPKLDRRIAEAWYFCPEVRQITAAPRILETLHLLYGRAPFPFQTLNFDRGTQQAAHSDTIHFHCVPRHFMCGVWAALEDVDAENGPLFIYPGSHRLPDYTMTDLGLEPRVENYGEYEKLVTWILEASGLSREELHLKKGQAVIWAANAFHGGTAIRDRRRTRHSQATHYYFEDCLYYFPMNSAVFAGKVSMREAIDIARGHFVRPRYHGREIRLYDHPYIWTYERPLPDWISDAGQLTVDAKSEEDLDLMRLRIWAMEGTITFLREEIRKVGEDNRRKDAYIRRRNEELAYKIARKLTKTWRALLGRPADESA
jgi:ectoine hydroxylase-related dioxygenase (phytanoyl-CoA dioxygenase family)